MTKTAHTTAIDKKLLWLCLTVWILVQGFHMYETYNSSVHVASQQQSELDQLTNLLRAGEEVQLAQFEPRAIHAVVRSKKGTLVYWTTQDQLATASSAGTSRSTSLSVGDYMLTYQHLDIRQDTTSDRWRRWLALLCLLCATILILQLIGHTMSETKAAITQVSILSVLVAVSQYLYLPLAITKGVSEGSQLTLLHWLTMMAAVWLLSRVIHKLAKKVPARYSILKSALCGLVVGASFCLFVSFIDHTAAGSVFSRGLDIPLHYYFSGITLLTSYVIFGMFTYLTLRDYYIHWAHALSTKVKYTGLVLGLLVSLGLYAYGQSLAIPVVPLLAFLLAYVLIADVYQDQKYKSVAFLFLWLIIYAGFIASCVFHFQLEEDAGRRAEYAHNLYYPEQQALTAEVREVDEALKQSTVFAQLASLPYPARLDVQDFSSFLEEQVPGISKYTYELQCYEADGSPIFRNYYSSITDLDLDLQQSSQLSDHIHYHALKGFYLLRYDIENLTFPESSIQLAVHIAISDSPLSATASNYKYLVQRDGSITATNTQNPNVLALLTSDVAPGHGKQGDMRYTVDSPMANVQVLVVRELDGLLKPISLFSFILTLAGIMLVVLLGSDKWLGLLPADLEVAFDYRSSLRGKIQFTIVSLTIFSFLLIGLMTIIYFKSVLEDRSAQQQESEISAIVKNAFSTLSGSTDYEGKRTILASELDKLSHIHEKQLALYDNYGKLLRSTHSDHSPVRMPYAVRSLTLNNTKSTGSYYYDYDTDMHYLPLRSDESAFAVLAIPADHQVLSNYSLLDFLSTILNVYIFLFLVAGTIAIAISNSITRPLSFLKDKLTLFKLGKNQEPLQWNTRDEIGSLINSYNQLIAQLDESANVIAKTERDTAWREMAKQVAHEIKNPLTPMKLSIQHLQRLSQQNYDDIQPMVSRISKTLLEQFNNLDNIANSFSNFATMPTASNEKIIINDVVESIHDLFRKREDMDISLSEPINDLYVFADRNQLVRVLNNIVKNAIQAIPEHRAGMIMMSLSQVKNNAVITVTDNGTGIPADMREKVFTPNFTTKSSGTGLGLAISANMIESFNGRIYFETEEGKGTSFYIEIPLMRLEDNYLGQTRVSLD